MDEQNQVSFEQAYSMGYEHGYQQAVKDMAKKIKELRTYGGDKQKKRPD